MNQELKQKLIPLWMTAAVITVDQLSKLIITLSMRLGDSVEVLGDFFRLSFRQNPYIIFSFGRGFPPLLQTILFFVLPVLAIGLLVFFYFREKTIRPVYRLPLAAIIGGGVGNLIDRVFREGGVVDFMDVRVYGFLGFERWPTFNAADSSIVVSVIAICIIVLIHEIGKRKAKRDLPKAEDET